MEREMPEIQAGFRKGWCMLQNWTCQKKKHQKRSQYVLHLIVLIMSSCAMWVENVNPWTSHYPHVKHIHRAGNHNIESTWWNRLTSGGKREYTLLLFIQPMCWLYTERSWIGIWWIGFKIGDRSITCFMPMTLIAKNTNEPQAF